MLIGFALWMGLTYMATLPPTTGLIAQLFGARNVATLFGVTTLVHQVGSFLGAWLGGLELELTGRLHDRVVDRRRARAWCGGRPPADPRDQAHAYAAARRRSLPAGAR